MAEAVGLAASVIAIAEITAKIGISYIKLKKLWEDLQDVPERLKDLVEEMEFWRCMMRQIEKQIRTSSSSVHQQLLEDLNLRAACGRCRSALDSLANFVDTLQQDVHRSTSNRQKIKLMRKIFSSAGPLDALDKRLHRAFSTLQGLLNVYNFSVGTGAKRLIERVPESNNEFIEASLQTATPDLAGNVPFLDGPARRYSSKTTTECVHKQGNLQRARTSQSEKQPEKYDVHDYNGVITARLNIHITYKICKTGYQLCQMEKLLQGSNSTPQLLEDFFSILQDYWGDILLVSKGYRPPPQLRLSGAGLSQYRFPKWLFEGRVVEFKADNQGEFPELSVGFNFSVDSWNDEIYRAVSDDDLEALLCVYSVKGISLWQRNGWSLLHLAARLGSVRICKILSDPPAMNSVNVMARDMRRTPWAFACLCTMGDKYADNYLRILRSFASTTKGFEPGKVENCLERHETLVFVITRAWSSLFVQGFRRQFAPRYHSLELSQRLMCARLATQSVFYNCSVELFIDLLPEAEMAQGTILERSREEKCSIIHSVAFRIGRSSWNQEHRSEKASQEGFWHGILRSAVQMDTYSLHFVENIAPFQFTPMHQTPLISLLQSAFDACMGDVSDDSIPRLLTSWLKTLKSSGVNLLLYGREEYRLYQANNSLLHQRFIAWTSRRQLHRIRLVGIVYGDLPQHWSLIWVDEPNGFAGDFWNLVEPQDRACHPPSSTVPGEWKDELDDGTEDSDDEDDDDIWRWAEAHEKRRLVWTEYRRRRDTTTAVNVCHGRKRRAEKNFNAISDITGNSGSPQIASQPEVLSVVAHSEPAKPSDAELRRKAKSFMKFWKRQR
ncbi:hypothetical protein CcaCcLH18_03657 [Colletotrichum camelliae]|nr:hypothetical protein CcaCcLH18_03657 [Colletotrichum camelliae]